MSERQRAAWRRYYRRNKEAFRKKFRDRYHSDAKFKAAHRDRSKRYYEKNSAKLSADNIKRRQSSPALMKAHREESQRYYAANKATIAMRVAVDKKKNPDKYHDRNLRHRFGITLFEYQKLLKKQRGVCWICKKKPGRKRLAVDHDHKTGKVRGLLCAHCNQGLGLFNDSIKLLKQALRYLKERS